MYLTKLTGRKDDEDGDGSDDEDKKKKGPTLYKLLKTRLQKLIDKTDSTYVHSSYTVNDAICSYSD